MTGAGIIGFFLVLSLALLAAGLILRMRATPRQRMLLLAGLALRIVGGVVYLYLINAYYGRGDYETYFRKGLELADSILAGDLTPFFDPHYWMIGRWWGTQSVVFVTGPLLALIGPTIQGAFIVFAMISYVGILSFGVAFQRAFPTISVERYFVWIALFPSLWFWPTALGKDALILCGLGLATMGFVGRRGHPNWLTLALGVALVFVIRPQVAAVLAFGLVVGYWFGMGWRWTPRRILQSVVLLAVGVQVLVLSSGTLGVELFRPDEVEGYLDSMSSVSARGESATAGGVSPWLAPVNVLFRPFLWEVGGTTALLAALEVLVLWGLAWRRRREIRSFIRVNRGSRLFWFGVAFVGMYTIALGLSLSNLGLIARQRIHIYPFIFMLFAGTRSRKTTTVRTASVYRTVVARPTEA